MAKAKTVEDTRTQRQKFIDAAREHGADADQDALRSIVRKIAPNKRLMEELSEAKAAEGKGALEKRMGDINRALKKKRAASKSKR